MVVLGFEGASAFSWTQEEEVVLSFDAQDTA